MSDIIEKIFIEKQSWLFTQDPHANQEYYVVYCAFNQITNSYFTYLLTDNSPEFIGNFEKPSMLSDEGVRKFRQAVLAKIEELYPKEFHPKESETEYSLNLEF